MNMNMNTDIDIDIDNQVDVLINTWKSMVDFYITPQLVVYNRPFKHKVLIDKQDMQNLIIINMERQLEHNIKSNGKAKNRSLEDIEDDILDIYYKIYAEVAAYALVKLKQMSLFTNVEIITKPYDLSAGVYLKRYRDRRRLIKNIEMHCRRAIPIYH